MISRKSGEGPNRPHIEILYVEELLGGFFACKIVFPKLYCTTSQPIFRNIQCGLDLNWTLIGPIGKGPIRPLAGPYRVKDHRRFFQLSGVNRVK